MPPLAIPAPPDESLRSLVETSLEAREDEARRIARELHDDAGQLFSWAFLALAEIAADLDEPARARLAEVTGHLRALEGRLSRLARELRPIILDELGLGPAVEYLAEGVAARTGLHVTVTAKEIARLPPALETAAYRIVQEALTNVVKHARALSAVVELRGNAKRLLVAVTDDGAGFDAGGGRPAGLGILGMRERLVPFGGTLSIRSAPGSGTVLQAEVPLQIGEWTPAASS